jgi:ATP-dependent DNA helicase RecG
MPESQNMEYMDDLMFKHASRPFNPDIANTFFRAALLESWGRGIDLMRRVCQKYGSPIPLLRWSDGMWVEFPFASSETSVKKKVETKVETKVKSPDAIVSVLSAHPEWSSKKSLWLSKSL